MPSNLLVQPPADGVRLITLHRPQALNALSTELLAELAAELDAAERDEHTRAVIITGSRKASPPAPMSTKWPSATWSVSSTTPASPTGNASPPSPSH